MRLSEITGPITFAVLGRDSELIRDIQSCLGVEPTGIYGPTTDHALARFAVDQFMNNAETRVIGQALAQALLAEGRKPKEGGSTQATFGERSVEPLPAPTALFEKALKFVLQWEGGYSNLPADKGGETNKGLTWETYNAYREKKGLQTQSVRLIKDWEVQDIYHLRYWTLAGCDSMPPKLAVACFDWQVNSGRGVRHLQEILGGKADGLFGEKTKNNLQVYLNTHGEAKLLQTYLQKREDAYRRWATGNQTVFRQGWLNRLQALKTFIATLKVEYRREE